MIKKTLTCDSCLKILGVPTSYPHEYILTVDCVDVRIPDGNATFAVAMSPEFIGAKHFCNRRCLVSYFGFGDKT